LPKQIQQQRDKANDLEGAQDQGGKHGGQAGVPDPTPLPGSVEARQDDKVPPDPGSARTKAGTR